MIFLGVDQIVLPKVVGVDTCLVISTITAADVAFPIPAASVTITVAPEPNTKIDGLASTDGTNTDLRCLADTGTAVSG